MKRCPLCGSNLEESDLTRHYLNEPSLISFIQKSHQKWTPALGACSRCLENYYQQYTSISLSTKESADEKTVVTEAEVLIQEKAAEGGSACLITIHGADLGKKYDLTREETLIGRGETAHVRINEENVSRLHATLRRMGTDIFLEDQNSTNGTFVNTKKIRTQLLKDGDLVLIGNTILKFMSTYNVEHQYHEEIYRLATLDGLTRTFNKNFFLERLEEEFGRSKRYERELSLLLFDFDHFKKINDTFGHPVGDEILKKTTHLVLRNLRKEDIFGRYGGEEFGILLPETNQKNALQLAEKLRKLVETYAFEHNKMRIPVTISIGVTSLNKSMKNARRFIEAADRGLYLAKNQGRNCIRAA